MSIIERLTRLYAPDDCLQCGREGSLLCNACLPGLPSVGGSCAGCRTAVVPPAAACDRCMPLFNLESLQAATGYQGAARLLVSCLKFHGNQAAAERMASRITQVYAAPNPMLIIPVPATTQHIRQRGYDQAEVLARRLARKWGISNASLLRRIGNDHQLGSDRSHRLQQLQGAVSVARPFLAQGVHILLVDDVLTTGASFAVAAQALRAAGAVRVDAVAFSQA